MPALVLSGNLKIGAYTGVEDTDAASAIDVSDEITHFKITAAVDQITVPATMNIPEHARGGAADYMIEIGYLSNDITQSPASVFRQLYAAAITTTATLYFEGTMRGGAVSATNPEWSGGFIVSEAEVGGDASALSVGSATYPLVAAPVQETT